MEKNMPEGSGWEAWIITTALAVITTMAGTVVALTKFIQGQYQATIMSLTARVTFNEVKLEEHQKEIVKCATERAELHGECFALRSRLERLEKQ